MEVYDLNNNRVPSKEYYFSPSLFDYNNLSNAVTVFKKGGNVIFKNLDNSYPDIYVQMSGIILNFSTMMYTISAFSFDKLYSIIEDNSIENPENEKYKKLIATGVEVTYICPLMYTSNPLTKSRCIMTCSNKLRTYSVARYYKDDELLNIIVGLDK